MKIHQLISLVIVSASLFFVSGVAGAEEGGTSFEDFAKNAKGQVVIVTGSNRGQGLGWVKSYLATGDSVIATCRKPGEAEDLHELAEEHGPRLLIAELDVMDEGEQKALGENLAKAGIEIDLAVSNAGVTVAEEFGEWTKRGFEINIGVNTIGAALFAQAIAPQLKEGAKLIHISSGNGSIANQRKISDLDAYGVSKVGLNMLTKKLSLHLADRKVVVVSMTPGMVLTDMNPNGTSTVEEAIAVLRKTVEGLTYEETGTFINKNGKAMAW